MTGRDGDAGYKDRRQFDRVEAKWPVTDCGAEAKSLELGN